MPATGCSRDRSSSVLGMALGLTPRPAAPGPRKRTSTTDLTQSCHSGTVESITIGKMLTDCGGGGAEGHTKKVAIDAGNKAGHISFQNPGDGIRRPNMVFYAGPPQVLPIVEWTAGRWEPCCFWAHVSRHE